MVTVGDGVLGHSIVLNGSYLDIQPSGTTEYSIYNFFVPKGVTFEIYRTDGSNPFLLYTITDSVSVGNILYTASNSVYFRMKNVSGASSYAGYDGRISKV